MRQRTGRVVLLGTRIFAHSNNSLLHPRNPHYLTGSSKARACPRRVTPTQPERIGNKSSHPNYSHLKARISTTAAPNYPNRRGSLGTPVVQPTTIFRHDCRPIGKDAGAGRPDPFPASMLGRFAYGPPFALTRQGDKNMHNQPRSEQSGEYEYTKSLLQARHRELRSLELKRQRRQMAPDEYASCRRSLLQAIAELESIVCSIVQQAIHKKPPVNSILKPEPAPHRHRTQ
jgi:hypothetical protein